MASCKSPTFALHTTMKMIDTIIEENPNMSDGLRHEFEGYKERAKQLKIETIDDKTKLSYIQKKDRRPPTIQHRIYQNDLLLKEINRLIAQITPKSGGGLFDLGTKIYSSFMTTGLFSSKAQDDFGTDEDFLLSMASLDHVTEFGEIILYTIVTIFTRNPNLVLPIYSSMEERIEAYKAISQQVKGPIKDAFLLLTSLALYTSVSDPTAKRSFTEQLFIPFLEQEGKHVKLSMDFVIKVKQNLDSISSKACEDEPDLAYKGIASFYATSIRELFDFAQRHVESDLCQKMRYGVVIAGENFFTRYIPNKNLLGMVASTPKTQVFSKELKPFFAEQKHKTIKYIVEQVSKLKLSDYGQQVMYTVLSALAESKDVEPIISNERKRKEKYLHMVDKIEEIVKITYRCQLDDIIYLIDFFATVLNPDIDDQLIQQKLEDHRIRNDYSCIDGLRLVYVNRIFTKLTKTLPVVDLKSRYIALLKFKEDNPRSDLFSGLVHGILEYMTINKEIDIHNHFTDSATGTFDQLIMQTAHVPSLKRGDLTLYTMFTGKFAYNNLEMFYKSEHNIRAADYQSALRVILKKTSRRDTEVYLIYMEIIQRLLYAHEHGESFDDVIKHGITSYDSKRISSTQQDRINKLINQGTEDTLITSQLLYNYALVKIILHLYKYKDPKHRLIYELRVLFSAALHFANSPRYPLPNIENFEDSQAILSKVVDQVKMFMTEELNKKAEKVIQEPIIDSKQKSNSVDNGDSHSKAQKPIKKSRKMVKTKEKPSRSTKAQSDTKLLERSHKKIDAL